jgi:hypothetical protein
MFDQSVTGCGIMAHALKTTGPDGAISQYQITDFSGGENR